MRENIIRTSKGMGAVLLLTALAACGSGLSSGSGSSSSGSGGSGSSTSSGVRIGSGTEAAFKDGVLSISSTSLSAGGSTSITTTIVDSTGALYNQSVTVNFNSPCFASGQAAIVDSTGVSGTSTTSTGTVIMTYTAKGCSSSDVISATAIVGSQTITATGTITVAAAQLGSIQFVSATPQNITLKGMGGAGLQETSAVIFAVKDSVGGVVQGATVSFALNTAVGGTTISTNKASSDANGLVQTIVQAGTVAEPIIVTASIVVSGKTISTQSSQLAINGGVPSQNHFSLSVPHFNVEGGDYDGAQDILTVRLADRFGNPVPNGTPVTFITGNGYGEGGSVQPSCLTTIGAGGDASCTATWTSQQPRVVDAAGQSHVGFAYILVYAIGEESFTDSNGDGVFDSGDVGFNDIGEIFAPSAEFAKSGANAGYLSGEMFYDYDNNGAYTVADGKWEGVNCQAGALCGTREATGVGTYLCLVMSTSEPLFTISSPTVSATAGGVVTFDMTDLNGNVMAAGAKVTLTTNNVQGATVTLSPTTDGKTYTVPNTTCQDSAIAPSVHFVVTVTITSPTTPGSGSFSLTLTDPGAGDAAGSGGAYTSGPVSIQ